MYSPYKKKMISKKCNICLIVYFVVSVLLAATFFSIAFVVLPQIISESIEDNVKLMDNTIQYDRFIKLPIPIYFKVHFFVIENADDVKNGVIPIVKEVGPFVYNEVREKRLLKKSKDILTYAEKWLFDFNKEASGSLNEDDEIEVINTPLLAILDSLEDLPFKLPITVEKLTSQILLDNNVFIKVKVVEYGFKGIKMCDPEKTISGMSQLVCGIIMLMNQKTLSYQEDGSMLFSLFGYKMKNDGPFTLKRGISELDKLGLITSYKGDEYTQFWNYTTKTKCDHVNGHNSLFPPFMKKHSSYKIYTTDICKTGSLNYVEESKFRDIPAYRFQTDAKSFSSPEEECICIGKAKDIDGKVNCFNEGVLDLTTCFGGSPVILSFPHLMFAHEKYQNAILGLNSSYTLDHNTYIDFEPHLGFPLKAAVRIQFNTVLRPTLYNGKEVSMTKNVPRALFPLLWIEDSFELTDELVDEVNEKLTSQLAMAEILKWCLVGISIILLVSSTCLLIYYKLCRK